MSTLQFTTENATRLRWIIGSAPLPRTRVLRAGYEPGRTKPSARRESPILVSKHSLLVRRCLAEPAGEFERCLSIAVDRMISAVEADSSSIDRE